MNANLAGSFWHEEKAQTMIFLRASRPQGDSLHEAAGNYRSSTAVGTTSFIHGNET